jgi:cold shock CspA family protein
MPEGTLEWFRARRGCGFVMPDCAESAIATVVRAGFGSPNDGQRLGRDLTREQERRFPEIDMRPVAQTGASVLNHVPGERNGPLVGTISLPDQPQSAGE